jgi:hypothetical protein
VKRLGGGQGSIKEKETSLEEGRGENERNGKEIREEKKRKHGRMIRGGNGLPRVSPGPAMPYPSTACR